MKTFVFLAILINQNVVDGARFPRTIAVNFDPYISVLDKDNRFRYSAADLSPLVSMVAEEFRTFFIEYTEDDFTHATFPSGFYALPSIAAYNGREKFNRVEVWISLADLKSKSTVDLIGLRESFGELASVANNYSENTVTTVLLPFSYFTQKDNQHLKGIDTFFGNIGLKWGTVVNTENCANSGPMLRSLRPDVILLQYPPNMLVNLGPSEVVEVLQSVFEGCRKKLKPQPRQSFKLGIIVSLPDTDETGKVNMSHLVETWDELSRWSEINGTTVVLSKAFDTPYEKSVELKTAGWWRLQENPNYTNLTEYKFERKKDIARYTDLTENEIQLKEQDNNLTIRARNYTGVILSFYGDSDIESKGFSEFPESDLQPLLKNISEKFSKIVILLEESIEYGSPRLNITCTKLRGLSGIKNSLDEILLLILPDVDIKDYFQDSRVLLQVQEVISTYVVPFSETENQSEDIVNYLKTNVLSNKTAESYKFGYAFNISVCSRFYIMSEMEREKINETINHPGTHKVLFYFDEDQETVKLGANRMFQQRKVIFEQCRKFVADTRKTEGENGFEFVFVMLHYATNSAFHEDLRALVNFVKYWEMLSAWALSTRTMVILGDAMDAQRVISEVPFKEVNSVGWWRHHENEWVDKRTEAVPSQRMLNVFSLLIGSLFHF